PIPDPSLGRGSRSWPTRRPPRPEPGRPGRGTRWNPHPTGSHASSRCSSSRPCSLRTSVLIPFSGKRPKPRQLHPSLRRPPHSSILTYTEPPPGVNGTRESLPVLRGLGRCAGRRTRDDDLADQGQVDPVGVILIFAPVSGGKEDRLSGTPYGWNGEI